MFHFTVLLEDKAKGPNVGNNPPIRSGLMDLKVRIDYERCEGEGLCVDLCPVGTLKIKTISEQLTKTTTIVADDKSCILCRICEVNCPNQAIKITE